VGRRLEYDDGDGGLKERRVAGGRVWSQHHFIYDYVVGLAVCRRARLCGMQEEKEMVKNVFSQI
jgi:hypothetical protein